MTSQHSTGPQRHLNKMFIIQILSLLTGTVGLPWAGLRFWGLCTSWASLSLAWVMHCTAPGTTPWALLAALRGHERLTTDSPQFLMAHFRVFRLYGGVKAICIQMKPYLKILIFSLGVNTQYNSQL